MRGGLVVMLVVILYSFIREPGFQFSAPGRRVFTAIIWVNFMFISVAAIGYFATSVTEEKEEDTLGLLRMAGVSPLALLLGKSVSRLWLALVLICVQFPFALLAITLGGVTLRQVTASYVALGAYTFFLSGLATLCSVASKRSMKAVVYMVVASIALGFVPSVADAIDDLVVYLGWSPDRVENVEVLTAWVRRTSISARLQGVMTITFDEPVIEEHFIASVVAGLFFFGLAWLFFDFFADRHTDNSSGGLGRAIKKTLRLTPGRVPGPAIVWKDFHFGTGGYWAWIMRAVLLVAATAAFVFPQWFYNDYDSLRTRDIAGWLVGLSLLFAFIEATIHSIRLLSDEHAAKTLPILAMMPWSASRTIYSKVFGALCGLAPWFVGLVAGVGLYPDMLDDFLENLFREPEGFFAFIFFVSLLGVFLHLNAFLASYVKWAAVPISFGILLAFNMCCIISFAPRGGRGTVSALFFILSAMGVAAMLVLQAAIGQRFHDLKGR
jgi:ABC-type Na+ efflux pump permease subunit